MATVCVVGSINVDLVTRVERYPQVGETVLGARVGRFPGGKGFNQAVSAARAGALTTFCGRLGPDPEADLLTAQLDALGMTRSHVHTADEPTGQAIITLTAESDNAIVVVPGANAALGPAQARDAVPGHDVVLVQLEIPLATAAAALAAGRAAGATTILNAAPSHPGAIDLLEHVDVLVVNEAEARDLGGAEHLCAEHGIVVIETLGEAGSVCHRPGGRMTVPAFSVVTVDTTGAGDAYCGGLAAALARGADLPRAMAEGAAAGAIVASAMGAQPAELSADDIAGLVDDGAAAGR